MKVDFNNSKYKVKETSTKGSKGPVTKVKVFIRDYKLRPSDHKYGYVIVKLVDPDLASDDLLAEFKYSLPKGTAAGALIDFEADFEIFDNGSGNVAGASGSSGESSPGLAIEFAGASTNHGSSGAAIVP